MPYGKPLRKTSLLVCLAPDFEVQANSINDGPVTLDASYQDWGDTGDCIYLALHTSTQCVESYATIEDARAFLAQLAKAISEYDAGHPCPRLASSTTC